jgi:hypothetical protein
MDDDSSAIDLESLLALEGDLPLDEVVDLLSNSYARYTVYYLFDQPTPSLDQLTDGVAGIRATATDTIVTPTEREQICIHLYHNVLPRLDDLDYVDFDSDETTITRTEIPIQVYSLLGISD